MARVKSLVIQVAVDTAVKSHNCQASNTHRIVRGDIRLKVRNGRSWDHYCVACAEAMFAHGIQKLTELRRMQPTAKAGG